MKIFTHKYKSYLVAILLNIVSFPITNLITHNQRWWYFAFLSILVRFCFGILYNSFNMRAKRVIFVFWNKAMSSLPVPVRSFVKVCGRSHLDCPIFTHSHPPTSGFLSAVLIVFCCLFCGCLLILAWHVSFF